MIGQGITKGFDKIDVGEALLQGGIAALSFGAAKVLGPVVKNVVSKAIGKVTNAVAKAAKGAGKTNPYDILKKNKIPQTLTDKEIAAANKVNLQMMAKIDLKMVNDVAREVGVDRNAFGEYIHELKADLGMKASQNFTYKQLLEYAKHLKGGK